VSISLPIRPPLRVIRIVLGLSLIWIAGITCGGGDNTGPTTVGINSSARSVSFSVAPGGSVGPKTISVTPSSGQLTGLEAAVTFVSPAAAPPWLAASFAGTTATLDAPGVLTLQVTRTDLPPDAYTATITVSADNAANAPKVAVSFTIEAASALVLTTQPSTTATSGAPLGQAPVVELQTASGAPVAQPGVEVAVEVEGGGTLAGPSTSMTDAQGLATFEGLAITAPAGDQTLLFTAPGLTEVRSNPVAITAGSASRLSANSVTTQLAEAGTPVNEPPVVLVTDEAGNPIAGVAVTFAVTGGGVIDPTTPVSTIEDGTASLNSWQLGPIAGANTVTATAAGLAGSPLQFDATGQNGGVVPGPVSGAKSSVSASPATFTAGGSGTTITVTARDGDNNLIGGAAVTLSSSGSNFAFGSTSLTTGTNGLTLGKATTTYTSTKAEIKSISAQITAGATTASPAAAAVTVAAGAPAAAASTVVATTPVIGLVNNGVPSKSTVTITVKDVNSNPVSGRSVTLAFTSGTGAGGSIAQPTSATSPGGVTQASITSSTGGTYTVQATVTGGPLISQPASTTFLVSYATDIGPLFAVGLTDTDGNPTSACNGCHPSQNGLVPDLSYDHITDSHEDQGFVVVPGDANNSQLIKALEHDASLDQDELMPSASQQLPQATIDLIRRWINQNGTGQLQP
jgi:hypothetical protein